MISRPGAAGPRSCEAPERRQWRLRTGRAGETVQAATDGGQQLDDLTFDATDVASRQPGAQQGSAISAQCRSGLEAGQQHQLPGLGQLHDRSKPGSKPVSTLRSRLAARETPPSVVDG